jgi:hypothetical protein
MAESAFNWKVLALQAGYCRSDDVVAAAGTFQGFFRASRLLMRGKLKRSAETFRAAFARATAFTGSLHDLFKIVR